MEIKKYINKRLKESLAANGYANADAIREEITRHLEDIAYGNGEANTYGDKYEEQIETLQLGMKQLHQQMRVLKDELQVLKQEAGFI